MRLMTNEELMAVAGGEDTVTITAKRPDHANPEALGALQDEVSLKLDMQLSMQFLEKTKAPEPNIDFTKVCGGSNLTPVKATITVTDADSNINAGFDSSSGFKVGGSTGEGKKTAVFECK